MLSAIKTNEFKTSGQYEQPSRMHNNHREKTTETVRPEAALNPEQEKEILIFISPDGDKAEISRKGQILSLKTEEKSLKNTDEREQKIFDEKETAKNTSGTEFEKQQRTEQMPRRIDNEKPDKLSGYTVGELKELLLEGRINRMEYDAEMKSRNVSDEKVEEEATELNEAEEKNIPNLNLEKLLELYVPGQQL